jgi:hypothetical protein
MAVSTMTDTRMAMAMLIMAVNRRVWGTPAWWGDPPR